MNIKRFVVAAVVLFLFIFAYEVLVHGFLLMDQYSKTPHIWRDYSEMQAYIPFNNVIKAILAIWITFIFTRFFKEGGWKNGLRFGFYVGVLSGVQAASAYYYLPISATLAACWFIANYVECLIGGLLIGAIYHK